MTREPVRRVNAIRLLSATEDYLLVGVCLSLTLVIAVVIAGLAIAVHEDETRYALFLTARLAFYISVWFLCAKRIYKKYTLPYWSTIIIRLLFGNPEEIKPGLDRWRALDFSGIKDYKNWCWPKDGVLELNELDTEHYDMRGFKR